jgi:transcriptional regulator with XRE-family HTH domain
MSTKLDKVKRRNKKDVAERLKAARNAQELSQQALADKAKLSRSSIVHYERGTAIPGGQELIKLSAALKVTPNHILGVSEKSVTESDTLPPLDEILDVAQIIIFYQMLDKPMQESIATIILSTVKARIPQKDYDVLINLSEVMKPYFEKMVPGIEDIAENVLDSKSLENIEKKLNSLYGP